jgi:digeranylgeranylglycerophospholipid reductase
MNDVFDAIVVGAGPAGLNAALHILKEDKKPSVLLLDKIVPWEKTIACAEGVWSEPFRSVVNVKPEWIRFSISKIVLHSPDGTAISYFDKNKGYIINRATMQRDMAQECAKLGAHVNLDSRVVSIEKEMGGYREVRFADGLSAKGKVVIDASGPVSGLGRQDKIAWKPSDLESAYFAVVKNVPIKNDEVHIYLGRNIAPGGYAWAFPRENNTANVGIVLGRTFAGKVNISLLLNEFLKREFPDSKPVKYFAGTIPCDYGKKNICAGVFFKAGDAASTVNPVSRAGIVEAMVSGGLAGDFGLRIIEAGSEKLKAGICKNYHDAWRAEMGKTHGKLSKVKDSLLKVPDGDYNAAFKTLKDVPQNNLQMSRIIGLSLGRFPRLALAIRHLI